MIEFYSRLAEAAEQRAKETVKYDGSYISIQYPGGDVPPSIGVCLAEVIRVYRALAIDLQKDVHEDMVGAFSEYPSIWGLSGPDTNIYHRRVPNLMTFFKRSGETWPITKEPESYSAGDIIAWELQNKLLHIGVVVRRRSSDGKRPLILHNIGRGPQIEDAIFVGKIIGHFRYSGLNTGT